ncbi:MAG: ABC transporter substrate-binding protein [Proteobacteria bacterium]|nr:ABC transporter substrate-binding protein [Pseudomonadota bacterium]
MGCCETRWVEGSEVPPSTGPGSAGAERAVDRRTVLKSAAALAGMGAFAAGGLGNAAAAEKHVTLAFCGQLLCVIPYEVTRAAGFFKAEGIDIELVYSRGGTAAMQALLGGAVDYAGTAFDVALQAFARGAEIRRFASTGRLPLFALATSPQLAGAITEVGGLAGRTVGVSGLGNADHALVLYLLRRAGKDASKVEFATLGPNLSEALRLGQIDAGMVQEPALSRVAAAGSRVLVNFMDSADAAKHLGGAYEFMGVSVRAGERDARKAEMAALSRALQKGLERVQAAPIAEIVAALPRELVLGADMEELRAVIDRYRASLYPTRVQIDAASCERVAESLKIGGLIGADVKADGVLDLSIAGS